ncbi:Swr1p complex component (Swc5), putative [Talaromyces stipitatus ATCC 10500]|uniref:SWR1-complex protein 5 n=1 Tax=Talaromyces stipitatus (strain ATCC 10500 / CBS 375.48 / QM 6759 / NRRL 1006) TaxID=441959 RepID=B8M3E9_TALSN|nr:Swr1p complex component (Swc5), putative [Talaromyces stipitatus ATCC 10500]EED22321.1 Swr1p complex component (Swc5), putative [Talaromyces stipitatus ATCC 10500]
MAKEIEVDPSTTALALENDAYDSEDDSDFQLDEADVADDDSGLSSSGDEDEADNIRPTKKRKIDTSHRRGPKKRKGDDENQMELDSGDEATILKAKSKKQKKKGAEDGEEEELEIELSENEGGGFVKTRAMRMKMQEDRKPLAKIDGATIDVDALWAKMNAPNTDSGLLPSQKPAPPDELVQEPSKDQEIEKLSTDGAAHDKLPSENMIKIKRTYKFAGEIHTEEKLVPRDSAEAKLYLAETTGEKSIDSADTSQGETIIIKLRRPLRKISRFDPNPSGVIKKSWEKQAVRAVSSEADELKGPKLNTVEKSRLDWAQYVDEAGIKDELNVHSKAKEGYLGRMDFLNRVDAIREEERRNIRLKGL